MNEDRPATVDEIIAEFERRSYKRGRDSMKLFGLIGYCLAAVLVFWVAISALAVGLR